MPKPLVNNKIIYSNAYGRIAQHDIWLNQGVTTFDSPTFANIYITDDATIDGNIYVNGNVSIFDTNIIEFEDNIILINRNETGPGVTLNQAGFEIERGTAENYRFVFHEASDTFRIGLISNLQAVATREDNPLENGIMIWNDTEKRIDARNYISIETTFLDNIIVSSTTNSLNASTGAISVAGGVGIEKDVYLNGTMFFNRPNSTSPNLIYTDAQDDLVITANNFVNINGGVSVSGDFFVNGTTTIVDTETVLIEDNLLVVNSGVVAGVDGGLLVKRFSDGISNTTGNVYAGVFFRETTDEFTFAFTDSDTAASTVTITDYIPIRAHSIHLTDTTDGINFSSGSFTTLGGGYIDKSLIVKDNITCTSLNSSTLTITSTDPAINFSTGAIISDGGITITCSTNSTNVSNGGGLLVAGGASFGKDVFVGERLYIHGYIDGPLEIVDNYPIIGYNTQNTQSQDIGLLYQRYQLSNDTGDGDVVSDTPNVIDTIPIQSVAEPSIEIQLSSSASALDNFYNGWWVELTDNGQVRQIIDYVGGSRTAVIDSPWTTLPTTGNVVHLYNTAYISGHFDKTAKIFRFGFATINPENDSIITHSDTDLRVKHLYITDTTSSLNASTGSIFTLGGISISNSSDASSITQGGSFTTEGGASIRKKLYVGENIGIGSDYFIAQESLHINETNATFRLQANTNEYSYIDFVETSSSHRFGIIHETDLNLFSLTSTLAGDNPKNATKVLTINSMGNIGINTTSDINSPLTLASGNFISADSTSQFLGIIAGNTNVNNYDIASRIILYGNDNIGNSGDVHVYAGGTSGSIKLFTNADTNQLTLDTQGTMKLLASTVSDNSSSGCLVLSGGIGVNTTQNATNVTNGGAITIAGGGSIAKDFYIGGDIYITGALNAIESVTTFEHLEINYQNTSGCNIIDSYAKTIVITNEVLLSLTVTTVPTNPSQNCQFEFELPKRQTPLTSRLDVIGTCSGYTDDTEIIPLFNAFCTGGTSGSTVGLVKFQSVSTAQHHLQIICRYTV